MKLRPAFRTSTAVVINDQGCLIRLTSCPTCGVLVNYEHRTTHLDQHRVQDHVREAITELSDGHTRLCHIQHDLNGVQEQTLQLLRSLSRSLDRLAHSLNEMTDPKP